MIRRARLLVILVFGLCMAAALARAAKTPRTDGPRISRHGFWTTELLVHVDGSLETFVKASGTPDSMLDITPDASLVAVRCTDTGRLHN